jgi:hypothetical protein
VSFPIELVRKVTVAGKLGKGAVDRSNQSELSRFNEGITESGNANKGKKSAQVTVRNNTVGDAVAHLGIKTPGSRWQHRSRLQQLRAMISFPLIWQVRTYRQALAVQGERN